MHVAASSAVRVCKVYKCAKCLCLYRLFSMFHSLTHGHHRHQENLLFFYLFSILSPFTSIPVIVIHFCTYSHSSKVLQTPYSFLCSKTLAIQQITNLNTLNISSSSWTSSSFQQTEHNTTTTTTTYKIFATYPHLLST
jgi:hypothetical protein